MPKNPWWEQRRQAFDIFTSPLAWLEASRGDVLAARQRLDVIEEIASVDEQPDTGKVARQLLKESGGDIDALLALARRAQQGRPSRAGARVVGATSSTTVKTKRAPRRRGSAGA